MNGFLGTRGSFMLDVVFLAMFAIVPLLGWSIYLVRFRRRYALHKKIQIVLATVLIVAVTAFEVDMRLHGWEHRAEPSPFYHRGTWDAVWISLTIHLMFAIPTLLLWIWVLIAALRRFPQPPLPGPHSRQHRRLGQLAAWGMLFTAVTGWIFYWIAFIA